VSERLGRVDVFMGRGGFAEEDMQLEAMIFRPFGDVDRQAGSIPRPFSQPTA